MLRLPARSQQSFTRQHLANARVLAFYCRKWKHWYAATLITQS